MKEWMVIGGVALTGLSGVPGLFAVRRSAAGARVGLAILGIGALLGIAGSAGALVLGPGAGGLALAWRVPAGAFRVEIDTLSAMFLLQVFTVSLLGGVYGLGYWKPADHPDNGRKLRLFYGVMTAGMALLVVARNAVLFLAGWELMALAAFLTITTEDRKQEVREVGYVYLVATRIGTLCLFAMFALLFVLRGDLDLTGSFDARSASDTAVFLLAFVGFGLKAGVMPFHVWLPGAHTTAPSHVSALMSGVVIKMGIYGLVRVTSLFPSPPFWWGGLVLAFGVASGVLGVAFAIGQHDIKRMLAYHSVENIGIYMGLGVALLGRAVGRSDLVVLGLAGALLHVWNHGIFKALLFLAAGSVLHATRTRAIDRLGGLLKKMPYTALAFVVGSTAICGLPPLNGFVSELLVYFGLLLPATSPQGSLWLGLALSAVALALVGALAAACFVKVFGVVFLGEARSEAAKRAHESVPSMLFPMACLAAACVFIGLGSPLVAPVLDAAARTWAPDLARSLKPVASLAPLVTVTILGGALVVLVTAVAVGLGVRMRRAPSRVGTWDCGYASPTARMQYTSSSFAQVLVGMFGWALRPRLRRPTPQGLFPVTESFHSHVPDTVLDGFLLPIGRAARRGLRWFRWVQRGSVHAYLLYIVSVRASAWGHRRAICGRVAACRNARWFAGAGSSGCSWLRSSRGELAPSATKSSRIGTGCGATPFGVGSIC